MSNKFLLDLREVEMLHDMGERLFDLPKAFGESKYGLPTGTVAENKPQFTPDFPFLFRKTIPIMLCSAWESFVDDLKNLDSQRYNQHFPTNNKWYNDSINDIAQIRHCMAHQNGLMDQKHMDDLKIELNKNKYKVGEIIKLEPKDIDDYFRVFQSSYTMIMI
jgi:hypothetical protein